MGFYKSLRVANIITNILNKKIGKIILFVVLCGVLFLLFSNGVLAYETDVTLSTVEDLGYNANLTQIVSNDNMSLSYFSTSSDYLYTITNNFTSAHSIFVSTEEPAVGVSISELTNIPVGESYSFVGSSNYYFTFHGGDLDGRLTVTRRPLRGSDGAIADLIDQVTLTNTWGVIKFVIPLIGVAVLFALGFMVVRKLTKGEAKAKVKF